METRDITKAFGPMKDMTVMTNPPRNGINDRCFQP